MVRGYCDEGRRILERSGKTTGLEGWGWETLWVRRRFDEWETWWIRRRGDIEVMRRWLDDV